MIYLLWRVQRQYRKYFLRNPGLWQVENHCRKSHGHLKIELYEKWKRCWRKIWKQLILLKGTFALDLLGFYQSNGNWNKEIKPRTRLATEEHASRGLSASTRFVLSLRWLLRLDDVVSEFICTYWRVSAGPRLKSSGNPPEASEMGLSGSRDQCLSLMKGALPIKCSARLLLMMTHP